MLSSVGIQPCTTINISSNLLRKTNSPQNPIFPRLQTPFQPKQKPIKIFASVSSPIQETSLSGNNNNNTNETTKQKLRVVVKPIARPRLVLKFIWMEKNLGLSIDQVIVGGNGTIPLSPYYFWPRKDAWDELRLMLESKPWISHKQMVILLNQATDIINLWQQSGDD